MSGSAIRVRGLGKCYRLGGQARVDQTIPEAISATVQRAVGLVKRPKLHSKRAVKQDFWALRDVSFDIDEGEVIGIIGRNGAGKSTLLKILSQITDPTEGYAAVHGRVASLLEVGTGFHPELTGRENIYLNGSILGMSRREIKSKFDQMVAFSGVEQFLDTPIKRYSSGMTVRLAFAVAAHLDPEILIVDEVLAVGDVAFQKKCLGKMDEVAKSGRTVLLVSHNIGTITSLCSKAIYLEQGLVKQIGSTDQVSRQYLSECQEMSNTTLSDRTDRRGNGSVCLTGLRLIDARSHQPVESVSTGQDVYVEIAYRSDCRASTISSVNIGLAFFTQMGQFVTVLNSEVSSRSFEQLPSQGKVYCRLDRFPLMQGCFNIRTTLQVNGYVADQVDCALTFNVDPGDFYGTGRAYKGAMQGVFIPQAWSRAMGPAKQFAA